MKSKILATFNYCSDGNLGKLTRQVIDCVKGKPHFINPVPAIEELQKAEEEFAASLSNAGRFDREMVAIKNDKRAILRQLLADLATYVTQTCKGDRTLLLGSGFDIGAENVKRKKSPPKILVDLDTPRQATARISRVAGTRAYVFQYTADPLTPESVWIGETSLKPIHTFTGFQSATKIWIRVVVIDKSGKSEYWDPVMRIIH